MKSAQQSSWGQIKAAHGVWGILSELPRACQTGWHEGGMYRDFHREALNLYDIILHPGGKPEGVRSRGAADY